MQLRTPPHASLMAVIDTLAKLGRLTLERRLIQIETASPVEPLAGCVGEAENNAPSRQEDAYG